MMTTQRSHLPGAAAGLAYVVLVIAGNTLAMGGSTTDASSSADAILLDLKAHTGTAFAIGVALELCGLFAFLVFVAYVAGALRRLEGEEGWLSTVALGGGLLTLAVKVSSASALLAAVWRLDELDATTARTLVDVNGAAFLVSWATTAVFVATVAMVALRHRVIPRLLGWTGLALGPALVAGAAAGPEGPGAAVFMLALIWIVALSVVLIRRARDPREQVVGRKIAVAS
jgi:hypothetical protein